MVGRIFIFLFGIVELLGWIGIFENLDLLEARGYEVLY